MATTVAHRAIIYRMSPVEESDGVLVARCGGGDEDALAALYDRHGGAAYGLALRVARDAGLAEDAVQEGFLGVWRGARRFDERRGSVRSWILSVVHHKAVDLVRREVARRTDPSESVPEQAGATDVPSEVLASFERRRIDAALERLPRAQRDVLALAYFDGLTQQELALRLGEPLGTIKSRTHAALGRLREILQEQR